MKKNGSRYCKACGKKLKKNGKYNVARSWSPLKQALNVYYESRLGGNDQYKYYQKILNEFQKDVFKKAITNALIEYRELNPASSKNETKTIIVKIPANELHYNNEYEQFTSDTKSIFDKT